MLIKLLSCVFVLYNIVGFSVWGQNIAPNNYTNAIEDSTTSIAQVIQNDLVEQRGEDAVNTLIFRVSTNIIIPLVIFAGIFLALLGFYKIFTSDNSDALKEGRNYLTRGVISILIMVSARYIGYVIRNDIFTNGTKTAINGIEVAGQIYNQVLYPFLKLGMYLVIGVLFIIVIVQSYKYVTNDEETNQKTTVNVILANVIGILLIIGSKEIVEAVYGKRDAVMNTNFTTVTEIGGALFQTRDIPLYFQVINRTMGLVVVAILTFLLIQGFKLLFQPENDESIDETKNYILYATIGVLVLGTCYILTNSLIVSGGGTN